MRWLRLVVGIHRVHHIDFSYGYVFMPALLGRFGCGWRRVSPRRFRDCDATRVC